MIVSSIISCPNYRVHISMSNRYGALLLLAHERLKVVCFVKVYEAVRYCLGPYLLNSNSLVELRA